MKRIFFAVIAIVLTLVFSVTSLAAAVSLSGPISDLRSYYASFEQTSCWEETLAFASQSLLSGRNCFLPEGSDAETLALRLLCEKVKNADVTADSAALCALQNAEGSFGSVSSTALSILALRAADVSFNGPKAYAWLEAQQGEDGSFGSEKENALAIAALRLTDNDAEQNALFDAVNALIKLSPTDSVGYAWKIIGMADGGATDAKTIAALTEYQNKSDFSFSLTLSTMEAEPVPTAMALIALDAANRDKSLFVRLAETGTLSLYTAKDFLPLLWLFLGLLGASLIFWGFVLFHKKNTKTLEEAKQEALK